MGYVVRVPSAMAELEHFHAWAKPLLFTYARSGPIDTDAYGRALDEWAAYGRARGWIEP